ncbi:TfoX/Sxy family DNA transformation protein [Falsigemmobacter faecalis]|uniref:Competence protein TfoX n=1 Tax=Falsigemmobacter faecalis TaxID=2488730 RepID=A0A3P3DNR5_9RHOB|nr:TfoX/Sxy family DNA transformation protein [Falsigemmobacter faecalis]RRH75887.1 competence protein TfoX [Falsigemmobacter faecalis]
MSGTAISSIKNLGPASQAAFLRAGVQDAESLRAIGADEGYRRLLQSGQRPHFISYYVLHMALQGRPWNDCRGAEKEALRKAFDALVATTRNPGAEGLPRALAMALDFYGVRA